MSETPLQTSQFEIENAVLAPQERALRELEQETTYEQSTTYLDNLRAQIAQEAGELVQHYTDTVTPEYAAIPEVDAPRYLRAWGNTIKTKRDELIAA